MRDVQLRSQRLGFKCGARHFRVLEELAVHQGVCGEAHLGQIVGAIAEEVDRARDRVVVTGSSVALRSVLVLRFCYELAVGPAPLSSEPLFQLLRHTEFAVLDRDHAFSFVCHRVQAYGRSSVAQPTHAVPN